MDIIDPHLHLFNLSDGHYGWLKPENAPYWPDKHIINREVSQSELQLSNPLNLAGFVHIEAGFDNAKPWRELDWLEQHCTLPFKTVAGGNLTCEDFPTVLTELRRRKSLVGIRHILDEDAHSLLTNKVFQNNLALLAKHNLSFDAQFSLTDTAATQALCKVLDNIPSLRVIINHGGWPPLKSNTGNWQQAFRLWQHSLSALAPYSNVAIKLSGWEMQHRDYSPADMQNVIMTCVKILDERRVMLASNFPLNTFSCSYEELWQGYDRLLNTELAPTISHSKPSATLKNLLLFKNSTTWYQF